MARNRVHFVLMQLQHNLMAGSGRKQLLANPRYAGNEQLKLRKINKLNTVPEFKTGT